MVFFILKFSKICLQWPSVTFSIKNIYANGMKRFITTEELNPGILVGCGNPLLDISAKVDKDFLRKYDLTKNTAIMAEEKHKSLYKEMVKKYNVEYTAGGSVQNSLRACQWILQKPHSTVFFGCVGNDEYAKILQERALADGVTVRYQYTNAAPTGKCAALITGQNRTLVARLGASEHFSVNHLNEAENHSLIENAKYFYTSGFFLVVSLESVMKLAQRALECNECFAFNLSAEFVSEFFMSQLKEVMPYVDILFGNEREAHAFARTEGWNISDRKEIGKRIQSLGKKNCTRPRIVIITQGPLPVLMMQENSAIEFEIPKISKEEIVDSNGTGDGFVGGFFAQYMMDKPLEECVRCGIYTAQYILRQSGVNFEGKPNFFEN